MYSSSPPGQVAEVSASTLPTLNRALSAVQPVVARSGLPVRHSPAFAWGPPANWVKTMAAAATTASAAMSRTGFLMLRCTAGPRRPGDGERLRHRDDEGLAF